MLDSSPQDKSDARPAQQAMLKHCRWSRTQQIASRCKLILYFISDTVLSLATTSVIRRLQTGLFDSGWSFRFWEVFEFFRYEHSYGDDDQQDGEEFSQYLCRQQVCDMCSDERSNKGTADNDQDYRDVDRDFGALPVSKST